MSSFIALVRRLRPTVVCSAMVGIVGMLVALSASTLQAAPITYTMKWDSVTGKYGSQAFTNQPMTLTFAADTDNVFEPFPSQARAIFNFGEGVKVSVGGTALNNTALDSPAMGENDIQLTAVGGLIFLGNVYQGDLGLLGVFDNAPNTSLGMLTTNWTSDAQYAGISQTWILANQFYSPLLINSEPLYFENVQSTTGSFTAGNGASAVPEPSTLVMAVAGLAWCGVSMWRRRKLA
ncbi:MAG: PEP-CTERM sorting domain-containing protein [Planctomycetota bacterium]